MANIFKKIWNWLKSVYWRRFLIIGALGGYGSAWFYHFNVTAGQLIQAQHQETLPAPAELFDERFCMGEDHGLYCFAGTICMGGAMTLFRLLKGCYTKLIKYLHFLAQCGTVGLIGYGMYCIYMLTTSSTESYINFHGLGGFILVFAIIVQFILAFLIYIYLWANCFLRAIYTPAHDTLGVWIYISCVACCLSGKRKSKADFANINVELTIIYSYAAFVTIPIILSTPFFEWEAVGNL